MADEAPDVTQAIAKIAESIGSRDELFAKWRADIASDRVYGVDGREASPIAIGAHAVAITTQILCQPFNATSLSRQFFAVPMRGTLG